MRTTLLLLALAVASPSVDARAVRTTRCCLVIPVAGVPDQETCVQVRVPRRRLRPRLACRLIGGRPIGAGDCTLAACAR